MSLQMLVMQGREKKVDGRAGGRDPLRRQWRKLEAEVRAALREAAIAAVAGVEAR